MIDVTTATASRSTSPYSSFQVASPSSKNVVGDYSVVEWDRGELQTPLFRDKWFSVGFILQVIAVGAVAFSLGIPETLESQASYEDDVLRSNTGGQDVSDFQTINNDPFNTRNFSISMLTFIGVSAFGALGFTTLALFAIYRYPESCVKVSFIASSIAFFLFGAILIPIRSTISTSFATVWWFIALVSICCAYCYREYIPFASANLRAALAAIGAHYGMLFVGFLAVFAETVYTVVWSLAVFGVVQRIPVECYALDDDTIQGSRECAQDYSSFYFFMLLFAFYWTHQTIQGIIKVTVAGTVGTWWFEPGANQMRPACCSGAVRDSLRRSVTYSFGSICLGATIVAVVQAVGRFVRGLCRRGGILCCVAQCLRFRGILEYINDWAFVYVGLYGYGFMDGAKNVFQLFKSRNWTAIAADSLVAHTLLIISFFIAALTGYLSILVGYFLFGMFIGGCYTVGALFGLVLALIELTVVDAAVKTCIVCFAEAPREFEENHPLLAQAVKDGYAASYPDLFVLQGATSPPAAVAAVVGQSAGTSAQEQTKDNQTTTIRIVQDFD